MLSSDYQEFANLQRSGDRDNTVIWALRTRKRCEIRPGVAPLPRSHGEHETGTFRTVEASPAGFHPAGRLVRCMPAYVRRTPQ